MTHPRFNLVKVTKPFAHITAPYRCYTGRVLNQRACDFINKISDALNHSIVNFGEVYEDELNQRHRIVTDYANGRR